MIFKKLVFIVLISILGAFSLSAEDNSQIGVYEKLGQIIDLEATFTDETGKTQTIKDFMGNRPTIFSVNYYNCPGICGEQLSSMSYLIDRLEVDSDEYQVITVSIEPKDTPTMAFNKQKTFLDSMIIKPDFPKNKWSFLVGSQDNIVKFSDSVGVKYKTQVNKDGIVDYLHPGTLVVVSASGKITRYIYGIDYSIMDVKLALNEADEGRVSATRVQALKLCYAYDAESKKYIFQWEKIVGGFMLFSVITFFIYLTVTGRKRED